MTKVYQMIRQFTQKSVKVGDGWNDENDLHRSLDESEITILV